MTPAYASPEQVRGDRVTAASDIYSLGVVLYELLAGTLPYRLDGKRFETVEDAIREQDPEPPSAAFARTVCATTAIAPRRRDRLELARRRRALRGDLDAVLLKALRKEPEARYASAAALADDLRRVLAGQPVAARRGDWRYRAGKFLRRHRGAVDRGGRSWRWSRRRGDPARCAPLAGRPPIAGPTASSRLLRRAPAGSIRETRRLAARRRRAARPRFDADRGARQLPPRASRSARRGGAGLGRRGARRERPRRDRPGGAGRARARAAAPLAPDLAARRSGANARARAGRRATMAAGRSRRSRPVRPPAGAGRHRPRSGRRAARRRAHRRGGQRARPAAPDRSADTAPGRRSAHRPAEAEVALQLSEFQRAAAAAARARDARAPCWGRRARSARRAPARRGDRAPRPARRGAPGAGVGRRARHRGRPRRRGRGGAAGARHHPVAHRRQRGGAQGARGRRWPGFARERRRRGEICARVQLGLQAGKRGEVAAGLRRGRRGACRRRGRSATAGARATCCRSGWCCSTGRTTSSGRALAIPSRRWRRCAIGQPPDPAVDARQRSLCAHRAPASSSRREAYSTRPRRWRGGSAASRRAARSIARAAT